MRAIRIDSVRDLTPGELSSPGDVAHAILEGLIADFSDPAYRVQFFAGAIATVPCTKARLGFLPSLLISVAVGYAARWAYESAEEIKSKLERGHAPGGV